MAQVLPLINRMYCAKGRFIMTKLEKMSEMKDTVIISEVEGAYLGNISQVYINPETKKISSITYKSNRLFASSSFIPADLITRIGRDVIFVQSETNARELSGTSKPSGQEIKTFLGHRITTTNGRFLGNLADLEFDGETHAIKVILFTDGSCLPVSSHEVKFGEDEIIVPASIESKIKKTSVTGMLGRILGWDIIDQISTSVENAARRLPKETQHLEPTVR